MRKIIMINNIMIQKINNKMIQYLYNKMMIMKVLNQYDNKKYGYMIYIMVYII